MAIQPPSPPYLGPPFRDSGSGNKPIHRVVIHCTVSPCEPGGARNIAAYFRSRSAGGSAHYVVDPAETVQAAYDSLVCWHSPPNSHSLGIELCDPMTGSGRRWKDRRHQDMLGRAAKLTAQLCLAYDVPIRRLDPADLRAGKHGICGHDDVSDAFKQSSHWDPGPAFPWAQFMVMVRGEAKKLRGGDVAVPTPQPKKDDRTPTLITQARRVLRKAFTRADGIHRRQKIRAALNRLPER
jgi:N-acetylmuramoyl-L-alanine amidase-like protein